MKGGADINARNNSNQTALYVAINTGRKEIAKWLIEKGADVNAKNNNGYTPLMNAARHGSILTVEYLVEKGADVNAKDEDGKTALNYANSIRVEDFLMKLELGE